MIVTKNKVTAQKETPHQCMKLLEYLVDCVINV